MTTLKLFDNISRKTDVLPKLGYGLFWLALFVASLSAGNNAYAQNICAGKQNILAKVVVLDNPTVFNRLGAQNPNWITYALRRDVVVAPDNMGNAASVEVIVAGQTGTAATVATGDDVQVVDFGASVEAGDVIIEPGANGVIDTTPTAPDEVGNVDINRDVVLSQVSDGVLGALAGQVQLRADKRPRPLVVRGVAEACLTVEFTNLLTKVANPNDAQQGNFTDGVLEPTSAQFRGLINNDQVAGRCASFHATGTELVNSMNDDGSMVGANPGANTGDTNRGQANCGTGMVEPGATITYNLYTPHEGAFIINSYGATLGSEANSGNLAVGMFGALNVQPKLARMYRSQVTEEEMRLATADHTDEGQPIVDYEALYPDEEPWISEGKAGLPVLNMLTASDELVHSDINAIIAGPNADGTFPPSTYPLESVGKKNPQLPNRLEAFREFTSQYHDEQTNSQVFPNWYNHPVMTHVLHGVKDQFMINYGSGGIGSEIIANRLRTGPMHDCTDCAYEEFFLASQTVGDPALLVNFPANSLIEACHPENIAAAGNVPNVDGDTNGDCWRDPLLANGPIPNNFALFQEDPSNVHHTYPGDFVKMRNTHAGSFEQHIFHFHNHQWIFNPNDDNGNYLDAQEIMPGSGHTYELVNRGAGNRNSTTGDAIFHCHFYPHFAQGMWYHMRIHDVYETGTVLAVSGVNPLNAQKAPLWSESGTTNDKKDNFHKNAWDLRSGQPMAGARAYPDGELLDGSPIPAVVPLPGKPMPPMPAETHVIAVDRGDFALLAGREPPESLCTDPDNPGPDMVLGDDPLTPENEAADDFCGLLNQGPESSQAVVNRTECTDALGNPRMCAAGPDEELWDNPDTDWDETMDNRSPGYPFFLAGNECGPDADPDAGICPMGIVGQRMPTPPLDMLTEAGAAEESPEMITNPECRRDEYGNPVPDPYDPTSCLDDSDQSIPLEIGIWANLGGGTDGGLPRHALLGYVAGGMSADTQNRFDFRKIIELSQPVFFPELGTDLERVSMAHQALRKRQSSRVFLDRDAGGAIKVEPAQFVLNGAKPVPGAPYNDPCIDDQGDSLDGSPGQWWDGNLVEDAEAPSYIDGASPYTAYNPRTYKLANLQIDAVFNKVGYHYSQERIIILWEDITPTVLKERPPEPLVMRFNTFDCGKVLHANLVPSEFELDDFQVRTPTDIIGQHIHLPKWDLTSNDGAANGWNYEDGTLSPMMVVERIHAINRFNGLVDLGAACAAGTSGATWTDYDGHVFSCSDFVPGDDPDTPEVEPNPGLAEGEAILVAETLPGQLGPLNLGGLVAVPALGPGQGVDPHAYSKNTWGQTHLEPVDHYDPAIADLDNPQFSQSWNKMYLGARTTIQRILVDPVLNVAGVDRGLGLTFSHDHYGPSTFQQIGLYSTILAEPAGSTWVHNETGVPLNTRADGGPTTWQAAILTGSSSDSFGKYTGATAVSADKVPDHREFYFEMSDFQHAYEAGLKDIGADSRGIPIEAQHKFVTTVDPFNVTTAEAPDVLADSWLQAVNPTLKLTAGGGDPALAFPDTVNAHPGCPGRLGQNDPGYPRPCPEAINIGHSSMWVVNYRNEPIGLRVFDPNKMGPDGRKGTQAGGWNENDVFVNPQSGDLALAFQSRNDRAISALNEPLGYANGMNGPPAYPQASYCQGTGDGINCDRNHGDPFTPIMRAYEHDQVKVKIQVGATEEQHQTTVHGVKWLSNGSGFGRSPNSGWRNFQSHGISEQFSLQIPITPDRNNRGSGADYLYATDATRDGIWGGTWGILRSYQGNRSDLFELPDNSVQGNVNFTNDNNFNGVCPMYVMDENGDTVGTGKGKNKTLKEVPLKQFNVYAVRANDVLPNNLGVGIPTNTGQCPGKMDTNVPGDSDCSGYGDNEGGPLDPQGGTLVYNRRSTTVPNVTLGGETFFGGDGPLNDPTALMYVLEEDLEPRFIEGVSPDDKGWDYDDYGDPIPGSGPYFSDGVDDRCQDVKDNGDVNPALQRAGCPVKLKANAPVEPLVLRANAGDCIEATLYNKLADQATTTVTTTVDGVTYDEQKLVYVGTPEGTPVFSDVLALKNEYNLVDESGAPVDINDVDYDIMPDLAGWQSLFWVVNRDLFKPIAERLLDDPPQMRFFGNNLIRPSAMAGLHAQLVEYDASQDDGVVVGQNPQSIIAGPGEQHTYRWYAGHIETVFEGMSGNSKNQKRDFKRLAFPIEFGGSNLLSADRVKQPQKGMFGALVIEPMHANVTEDTLVADGQMACEPLKHEEEGHPYYGDPVLDMFGNTQCAMPIEMDQDGTRLTRAQVDVEAPDGKAGSGGNYRETVAIAHKITNLRWADGSTIKNVGQAQFGVEGAEDSGHAGFNYGMEPGWFRFQLPPDVPSAGAKKDDGGNPVDDGTYGTIPNPQAMYSNELVADAVKHPNFIPDITVNGEVVAKAGDPQTPVFRTTADPVTMAAYDTRMHVLNGASADRDSTYVLHGHVWPRDPYICTGPVYDSEGFPEVPPGASDEDDTVNLVGRCDPWALAPSNALGLNQQAKYMGGEEGMGHVFGHWPILFDAGGTGAVTGDYLFRDYAPNGNRNGMFGILRVE